MLFLGIHVKKFRGNEENPGHGGGIRIIDDFNVYMGVS